jgi:hypothetical protein
MTTLEYFLQDRVISPPPNTASWQHVGLGTHNTMRGMQPGGQSAPATPTVNIANPAAAAATENFTNHQNSSTSRDWFIIGVYLIAIPLILLGLDSRWPLYYFALLPVLREIFRNLHLVDPATSWSDSPITKHILHYGFDGMFIIGLAGVIIMGILDTGGIYWAGLLVGVFIFAISVLYQYILPPITSHINNNIDTHMKSDHAQTGSRLIMALVLILLVLFITSSIISITLKTAFKNYEIDLTINPNSSQILTGGGRTLFPSKTTTIITPLQKLIGKKHFHRW